MTKSKVKPEETIGDDLQILTFQVNRIMKNCSYQNDIKREWVQWVTEDVKRTSLKSITQGQAKKIIMAQEGSTFVNPPQENWANFDNENAQHKAILSLLYQLQWVKSSERRGEIPDLERLSKFLQSDKSPVKKRLKDMAPEEVSKIIECFNSMVIKNYK